MSMTLRRNTDADQTTADGQPPEAETQMRRALGLLPSSGPRARARAGDGPVVEHRGERQPGSSINRVAAAEAALIEERHAREQLSRQLRDAESALREAQTKHGHAELARDEAIAALAAERSARDAAEEKVRELTNGQALPAALPSVPDPYTPVGRRTRQRASIPSESPAPAKRRGRPPGSMSKGPRAEVAKVSDTDRGDGEAVEWWVPGWQERM